MKAAVLVLLLLAVHGGSCLRCYECVHHNLPPGLIPSNIPNNEACKYGSFDKSKVSVSDVPGSSGCLAGLLTSGDQFLTVRMGVNVQLAKSDPKLAEYMQMMKSSVSTPEKVNIESYVCNSDLCNSSAVSLSSVLILTVFTTLLVRLH